MNRKGNEVKIIASTKIQCPASKQRHAVTLHEDGSVTCDCSNGVERGRALAGRIMLGMPPPEGVRGCGALVAMVEGVDSLVRLDRGTYLPEYGPWGELVFAYGKNPIYRAALDLIEKKAHADRIETRRLLLDFAERADYRHKLGKRRFREEFKAIWDVPATDDLEKFMVSCFDDDPWTVPYMPGWREQIADKKLAIIGGKLVCGRSHEDPSIVYAVAPNENGGHWVRRHKLARGRLTEIVS